jgi:hypothetical protein
MGKINVIKGVTARALEYQGFEVDGDLDVIIIDMRKGEADEPTKHEFVRALLSYNIRKTPNLISSPIGTFYDGTVAEALDAHQNPNGDIWIRIGYNQWVAYEFNGRRFCEYVEEDPAVY